MKSEEYKSHIMKILLKNYRKIESVHGVQKVIFDDRFEEIADEILLLIGTEQDDEK